MLDDARNRYTAVEDLQDQANKLMALLNAHQRTLADPKLLPMPTQTPRKAI
jgi:plasmid replication initiation protein